MSQTTVVRARIDENIKEEASAILATMGLTISDAFRLLLFKIAKEKVFPFEPLIPNNETIAAMYAARRGELTEVKNVNELLASLDEKD